MTEKTQHHAKTEVVDHRPGANVIALKPYPIGTAARLAGIPPETLRIWERRYALLSPGRTDGGHRLYSEEDVNLLRAVRSLVESGMRIGAIARLDHDHIFREAERVAPTVTDVENQASPLIEEIIASARTLDERRVGQLLDRPLMLTTGDEVCQMVYLPLMQRVGDLWHAGRLSVGVEHFVEKMVTTRVLAILQATPQSRSGELALLACPPGERHEVGLLSAAVALKMGGIAVTVLGADLPAADLESAVRSTDPSLLVLASTNQITEAVRRDLVPALGRDPCRSVPTILGGATAEALAALVSRTNLRVVGNQGDLLETARQLLGARRRG